jgi:16S rRNA (guanine527-N7)-methyltransferase
MSHPPVAREDREPLPLDAGGVPPLGPDAERVLLDGLAALALDLAPAVLSAIDTHARLLMAWGRHVNLTSIRDPVGVARLHVLDSLSAVGHVRVVLPGVRSVVDIGSGGGYPGIPLGLALGAARLSLVESIGRKARFLETAGAAVEAALGDEGTGRIEVLPVRAEALAAGERRASWDLALVRAVGTLAESAELALPLLRVGGLLVCWKREGMVVSDLRGEVDRARPLIGQLGGGAPRVVPAGLPEAPGHRLVLVRKERPTPARFPRSPATRRPVRRAC